MGIFSLFGKKNENDGTKDPARTPENGKPEEAAEPHADWFRKEEYEALVESKRGVRHVVAGVFGDDGGGKTLAVAALERTLTGGRTLWERWLQTPAEHNPVKYVDLPAEGCDYLLVDCPGQPLTEADILALGDAAAKMDLAVLILSWEDGITPGDLRHMELLKATGVPNTVVFLNKCDRCEDPELLDKMEEGARIGLNTLGLTFQGGPVPILRGAALPVMQETESPWEAPLKELIGLIGQCAHE